MLLCRYVIRALCCYVIMLLQCYVIRVLCCYVIMLLQCYVIRVLCCYVVMLLQYYVIRVLCCYVVMLLQCYVITLSGYYTIAISQQNSFIYTLIINILQHLLSSTYNFTITIYILLYDTDLYVISVNQDAIVQYSIKLSILNI